MLSFLSPCVLPLVPSYLGVLGGQKTGLRALGFVLGFSLVFIALGASASALGHFLTSQLYWLTPMSGILIVCFGLNLLGILRIPFLTQDHRMSLQKASDYGPIALGAAFALGWTPCIGPMLGSILSLATTQGQLKQGVLLLSLYSLGLGIPFLLTALLWRHMNLRWMSRYTGTIEKCGGVLLVVVGILIATGQFVELSRFFLGLLPEGWTRFGL